MLERITPGIDKFYVACGKTDMRMGINGLVNKITTEFKLEPCENSAFLFCGIRKDRIKVLLWDQISVQQLEWLLRGMEIEPVKPIEKITGARFTERNSIVQNLLKS